MKIIFLAYRPWALNVAKRFKKRFKKKNILIIKKNNQINKLLNLKKKKSLIFVVGWSTILKKNIVNNLECYGVHPSDLPKFRGGSPIQNQILNNIIKSKVTLYRLSERIDGGKIYLKKNLSLKGDSINHIFINLENAAFKLILDFYKKYPRIKPIKINNKKGTYFKRRKPSESRISIEDFKKKGLKFIYNKIRCLTYPYPNAYIQDKKGNKLYFEKVKYIKK